jgi:ribosomal protein L18E
MVAEDDARKVVVIGHLQVRQNTAKPTVVASVVWSATARKELKGRPASV